MTDGINDHDNGKCPGCGGMFSLIGRKHLCSGWLLQKDVPLPVPRADAKPETRIPVVATKKRIGRTAGLIPATGSNPGSKPVRGWRADAKLGDSYPDTDHHRAYMREYMRNRRAAKREK